METIAVYAMLFLSGVAFLGAVIGIIGGCMEFIFKNKAAAYWWRIAGGISFISQAAAGAVAVGYIHEGRLGTALIVVIFLAIGIALTNYGFNLRQKILNGDG